MTAQCSVSADLDRQILIDRPEGNIDMAAYEEHFHALKEIVGRLRSDMNVLLLIDARNMGKVSLAVRKKVNELFDSSEVCRVALWGCRPVVRTIVHFFSVAFGENKVNAFDTEEQARDWLLR